MNQLLNKIKFKIIRVQYSLKLGLLTYLVLIIFNSLLCFDLYAQAKKVIPTNNSKECPLVDKHAQSFRLIATNRPDFESTLKVGNEKKTSYCQVISPDEIKLIKPSSLLLIDIRDTNDFRKYHIPNSLNIPASTLSSKSYWKSKHLVLINEGFNYRALDKLCENLKNTGYTKIYTLEGGIRAWDKARLGLSGLNPASDQIKKIKPSDFLSEINYEHWLILKSNTNSVKLTHNQMEHVVVLNAENKQSIKALSKKYNALKKRIESNPQILVIDNDPIIEKKLLDIAEKVSTLSFTLIGGFNGLQEQLLHQKIIWNYQPGRIRNTLCKR